MTQPLTAGEKNRRANIRRMKALGVRNAKARQKQAMANHLGHIEAMNQRSIDAATARAAKRLRGLALRDAHNAALRDAAAAARAKQEKAGQMVTTGRDGEINRELAAAAAKDAPMTAKDVLNMVFGPIFAAHGNTFDLNDIAA